MNARDPWRAVKMWIRMADGDLRAAEVLAAAPDAPAWGVAFHTQQCVEKYLKALLSFLSIPFGKTHDISRILALIPAESRPVIEASLQQRLTEYAVAGRYTDELTPQEDDLEAALAAARGVRAAVRQRLPKEALS